jgi:hypothetical protein
VSFDVRQLAEMTGRDFLSVRDSLDRLLIGELIILYDGTRAVLPQWECYRNARWECEVRPFPRWLRTRARSDEPPSTGVEDKAGDGGAAAGEPDPPEASGVIPVLPDGAVLTALLRWMSTRGPVDADEIAAHFGLSKAAVISLLDALCAARGYLVHPAGAGAYGASRAAHFSWQSESGPPGLRDVLKGLNDDIVAAIRRDSKANSVCWDREDRLAFLYKALTLIGNLYQGLQEGKVREGTKTGRGRPGRT